MSDDIVRRLRGLATAPRQPVPVRATYYRTATVTDDRRGRQYMTAAELLPAVSAAFDLAGLDPAALVVTERAVFPVMSPAGDLVAELRHDPHRLRWHACRYGDRWTWEIATGTLGELTERIAEWMAASQRATASRPRRVLPLVNGGPRAVGPEPVPAAPTPVPPPSAAPTPAAPVSAAPTPAAPTSAALPTFLVTSPTYSLVAELWHDPHRSHWHAARHQDGRTRETATGPLGRLAERIAQWAPLRDSR